MPLTERWLPGLDQETDERWLAGLDSAVVVGLSPVTFDLSPQAVEVSQVTVDPGVASFALSPQTLTPSTEGAILVDPGVVTFSLSPRSLSPSTEGTQVTLGVVTFTLDAGEPLGVNHELETTDFALSPQTLTPVLGSDFIEVPIGTVAFQISPDDLLASTAARITVAMGRVTFTVSPRDLVEAGVDVPVGLVTFDLSPQVLGAAVEGVPGGGIVNARRVTVHTTDERTV